MAYAPAVGRLECGALPSDPHGFWQENGYGILSVFKEDWKRFGGELTFIRWPYLIKWQSPVKWLVIELPKSLSVKYCKYNPY